MLIPQDPSKPVILLAFANEQGQSSQYLRNLPEELRQLQRVLRPGEREGRYKVVLLPNASLESLVETFQDPEYQGQLLLFHYGGHAGDLSVWRTFNLSLARAAYFAPGQPIPR